MKKAIVSLALIAFVIAVSLWWGGYMESKTGYFMDLTIKAQKSLEKGDSQSAHDSLSEANDEWERINEYWKMLLDHSTLDDLGNCMAETLRHIESEEYATAEAEMSKLYKMFEELNESHDFQLSNIF